jgi:hypothetical protein
MSLLAPWRSGYAAACKAVYTGSIPVGAFRPRNLATLVGFKWSMKWIVPLLAVALLAGIVLSGCGGDASGSTALSTTRSGASAQTARAPRPMAKPPRPVSGARADDPECPVDDYGPCGVESFIIVPKRSGH